MILTGALFTRDPVPCCAHLDGGSLATQHKLPAQPGPGLIQTRCPCCRLTDWRADAGADCAFCLTPQVPA